MMIYSFSNKAFYWIYFAWQRDDRKGFEFFKGLEIGAEGETRTPTG